MWQTPISCGDLFPQSTLEVWIPALIHLWRYYWVITQLVCTLIGDQVWIREVFLRDQCCQNRSKYAGVLILAKWWHWCQLRILKERGCCVHHLFDKLYANMFCLLCLLSWDLLPLQARVLHILGSLVDSRPFYELVCLQRAPILPSKEQTYRHLLCVQYQYLDALAKSVHCRVCWPSTLLSKRSFSSMSVR